MSKKKPGEEEFSCEMYSPKFFVLCGGGGAAACGLTHAFVTPLDIVKCRLQVDPVKYVSICHGFSVTFQENGLRGLLKGWAPSLIGYGKQGTVRFSGYEYFKYKFASMVTEETAYLQRTWLYLGAAATAEFIADCFLAPWEAVKVRMQTTPGYTSRFRTAMPHMYRTEGIIVFYRGLPPLWGRQIPYTMVKFASFERVLEFLYNRAVPKRREECSKAEQLVVTFTAGYIAGVLCAIVSHPADTIVSKLNKEPGASVGTIVSELGMMGIWRGLLARIVMIGTLAGQQWFIYDGFKVWTRLPRPPPPVMPESLKKKLNK